MSKEKKERPRDDQFYKENINLFACLFQAAMWQSTTFAYDFHFNTKYKIKKFTDLSYEMLDAILKEIKDDKSACQYFDEQTSFYMDAMREICTITDIKEQELVIEILKTLKEGKLKVRREEDELVQ